jgi:hypothetical protein
MHHAIPAKNAGRLRDHPRADRQLARPLPDALHVEIDANRKPVFRWHVRQQIDVADPRHALPRGMHSAHESILERDGGLADDIELKEQIEP